jgi:hypothetical protein
MAVTAITTSTTGVKKYNDGLTKELDVFTLILPDNTKGLDTVTVPSITGYSAMLVGIVDSTTGVNMTATQTSDKFTLGYSPTGEANGSRIVMQYAYRKV